MLLYSCCVSSDLPATSGSAVCWCNVYAHVVGLVSGGKSQLPSTLITSRKYRRLGFECAIKQLRMALYKLDCDFSDCKLPSEQATGRNPDWQIDSKKEKSLIVSTNDDNSNEERVVQDVGGEDIMYEPLLDVVDVETLMDGDYFEIDMGSRDGHLSTCTSEEVQVDRRPLLPRANR